MEVKKNEKNCEIIKDLIPMYVDDLTSEETNRFIKKHISSCVDCSNYLRNVQRDIPNNDSLDGDTEKNDQELMKNIKHRVDKMIFIALLVGILIGSMVLFNMGFVLIGLCVFTVIYLLKTRKEMKIEKRGLNLFIFVLSFISLVICLKLFWNIAIYVDDFAADIEEIFGSEFWLYTAWLQLPILAIITFISGIKLFRK